MVLARYRLETQVERGLALLPKEELEGFILRLKEGYEVFGPTRKGKGHVFGYINSAQHLDLDYQTTILPPKKLLHQPFETLFHFHTEEGVIPGERKLPRQVLFGLHPCDVHAVEILDTVYMQEYEDPFYKAKREKSLIVALNCTSVGEHCFCASMGTGPDLKNGYDLLLTDLGSEYLVEVGSEAGAELVTETGLSPAPRVKVVQKEKRLDWARRGFKKRLVTHDLERLLRENFCHPIWNRLRDQCLACGSCTMVCPTCFCYNVVDKIDLGFKTGKRQREWDSCMLLEYAQVALGHNFRKERDVRIKQRIYHKLLYYEPQFGTKGCVGCGRCIETCVKGIDLTGIIREIRGEHLGKSIPTG